MKESGQLRRDREAAAIGRQAEVAGDPHAAGERAPSPARLLRRLAWMIAPLTGHAPSAGRGAGRPAASGRTGFAATTRRVGDRQLVEVRGTIDEATAPRLRRHLQDALAGGPPRLVVDLTAVPSIDSDGLGVLVGVLKRARNAGGYVRLVAHTDAVLSLLRITGLYKAFDVCPSVETALTRAEPSVTGPVAE